MRIATLSIGDELICGEVVDTNASRIAALLLEHGLRVQRHLVVGDSETAIVGVLDYLTRSSDALIVTGGLGPTVDDVTARAAAHASGRPLVVNEQARDHVRAFLAARGRFAGEPPSDKQAMIPDHATLIPNPNGTACGFQLILHGCSVSFLPGVPAEMQAMVRDTVLPLLVERAGRRNQVLCSFLNVFGLSEPETDNLLHDITPLCPGLEMSICVTFPWVRVTLRVEAETENSARDRLQEGIELARKRLGEHIFSEGNATLDEVVAALFRQHGLTLALAESCTGGLISKRITDVAGSSAYFLEGVVTYSNAAKERLLGVPSAVLMEQGAVSAEVAAAMASGVRSAANSDLGLAVTGIAGPEGGTPDKPAGTVYISLAGPDGCRTERFLFGGSRDEVRTLTAWTALQWLRRYLEGRARP